MGYSRTELTSLCSGANVQNEFVGTRSGPVMVVGTGRCVWKDVSQARLQYGDLPVITVNDMVMYWPGEIEAAYSHDDVKLACWAGGRRDKHQNAHGGPRSLHTVEPAHLDGMTGWPFPTMGTSGLAACHLALAMCFDEVITVGIPLDDSGHFYDPPWVKTNFEREAQEEIVRNAKEFFQGRVKPVSGRFRELLC